MKLPLLEFHHLTVYRGGRVALSGLDLEIRQGEQVAILGPNGSGKSTLIKLITRELYPLARPEAVCRIFGKEIWDVLQLRSRLGVVSNDLQAAHARTATAFEAVLSGFFDSIGLWPAHQVTPAMEEKARSVLHRIGMAHLAERTLRELSSGEVRRLLIGRALVHDPVALLLDEPTNSLDFQAAHAFRELLRELVREGRTLITVTHTIADLIPETTRVVMLKAGRIHCDGPAEVLLTSAAISGLFDMRLRVRRTRGWWNMAHQP